MKTKIMGCLFGAFLVGQTLYAMQYAKVINGPHAGKIAHIEGTSQQIWGIDDIMSPKSFSIPVIANYLMTHPPLNGKVYYGKIEGFGYCFHESWLQEVSEAEGKKAAEEADTVVFKQIGRTLVGGPKWFVDAMQQPKNAGTSSADSEDETSSADSEDETSSVDS